MNQDMKFIYLKCQSLFKDLSEKELKDLAAITRIKTLDRSDFINYGDGDYSKIFFIVKGKIKITESNEMDEELVKAI